MAKNTVVTLQYGPDVAQQGDLHLPDAARPPVVCVLHGGFWRMPYGRDETTPLAADIARRGFAAWNLEYRRLGATGAGWPGTFDDVSDGIDHLAVISREIVPLDLSFVAVVGHSAGGHLALWSASRKEPRVRVIGVAAQAPIANLATGYDLGAGNNAVRELLGGTPSEVPERYDRANPRERLPLGVPQLVVHGDADGLPIEMSREYVRAARAAGDRVDFKDLPGVGHFEHLDVTTPAWSAVIDWLERRLQTQKK